MGRQVTPILGQNIEVFDGLGVYKHWILIRSRCYSLTVRKIGYWQNCVNEKKFFKENKSQTHRNLAFFVHRLYSNQLFLPFCFVFAEKSNKQLFWFTCFLKWDCSLRRRTWGIHKNLDGLLAADVSLVNRCTCTNKLNWSDLHYKRPEIFKCEVVFEVTDVKFQCGHVKVAVAEVQAALVKCKHVFSVIIA